MNFQRSLRTTIVIMCLSTQAGQPGAWTRIILERVKKKKKEEAKEESRGEREATREDARKKEREKRMKRGGGAREMEGERIQ